MRADPMTPTFVTVGGRIRETADVWTIDLPGAGSGAGPGAGPGAASGFLPGQFNMLYAFGIGEVPISISGDPADGASIVHTIRAVGPVSRALAALKPGDSVGLRGPFGGSWPVQAAEGHDVLLIAGGIGLAPLRPALYHLLRHRARYGRVALIYGARGPGDLLFHRELEEWRRLPDLQVRVTVDRAGADWSGDVGLVTALLPKVRFDPAETLAMICGPEVMIRFAARSLEDIGVAGTHIYASLERNMKCAIGLCGHCQFGPEFICRDGPVFSYDRIRANMNVREV